MWPPTNSLSVISPEVSSSPVVAFPGIWSLFPHRNTESRAGSAKLVRKLTWPDCQAFLLLLLLFINNIPSYSILQLGFAYPLEGVEVSFFFSHISWKTPHLWKVCLCFCFLAGCWAICNLETRFLKKILLGADASLWHTLGWLNYHEDGFIELHCQNYCSRLSWQRLYSSETLVNSICCDERCWFDILSGTNPGTCHEPAGFLEESASCYELCWACVVKQAEQCLFSQETEGRKGL